ncbi:MAG: class I adenylate-forming enzyme family protein [Myxococcota bacterium]
MLDPAGHGLVPSAARPAIPGGGPQSVADVLAPGLALDPAREALVGRHGRFSYAALDAEANRAAGALRALGVGPGDRVAACLPNDVDIVVAFLGAMRLGALWVGVNRPLAPPEKAWLLDDAGASLLLAAPDVADGLRTGCRIEVVDPEAPDTGWLGRVASAPPDPPGVAIDPFAPAAIAYTSGTTGRPKGAVHSQHNVLLPGAVSAATGLHPPGLPQGVVLPLTILNLIVLGPLAAFQACTTCVAMDRIDALGVAAWVRDERIHTFHGVPTLFHDLLTHPQVTAADLAPLRAPMVGGAECPEEFRALYRERFGGEVAIGYGMTEAPTAVTTAEGEPSPEPGLCGVALPQVEIHILDAEGRELPPGEEGEICVAPASSGDWAGVYTPMLGYWNRPDATAAALLGGVYHSGDVGVKHADGRVFIRGRRNELILRGGANVYPAEVERVLQELPAVAEAAVFGVPDRRLGERVVAAVVLAPGAETTPDALRAACSAELARYKVPERIAVVDTLPRNAMAKVVKRELLPLFEG